MVLSIKGAYQKKLKTPTFQINRKIKTVNVNNIGMLKKGSNKSQKSIDFESLIEAVYYQNLMGGRMEWVL